MSFIGKLLGNYANRLDPKFLLFVGSTRSKEKYNSVMALKMRIRDLKEAGTKYEFKEMW